LPDAFRTETNDALSPDRRRCRRHCRYTGTRSSHRKARPHSAQRHSGRHRRVERQDRHPQTAPELVRLRDAGTYFPNSHSVFPTFTTANASSLATGHQLGDTGDFSNTIWTAAPIASAAGSVTPFLENDAVLGEVDTHFGGNYLNETTVLEAARKAGYGTAAISKLGPALIQDHLARDGMTTIIVDDSPDGRAASRFRPTLSQE
jgi:hypothetical protein